MTDRFATLKYRVDKEYSNPLDEVFPDLFKLTEFQIVKHRNTNWQKMVRYVVFMYTKGTPLVNEFPSDLKARKEAALIESGYKRDVQENWDDEAKQLMDVKLEDVFRAIMAFLRHQKHMLWTEIVVCEQELYDYQSARFKPLDKKEDDKDIYAAAKNKGALKELCDTLRKSLDTLYEQFYGDSKEDLMNSEFTESIRPETAERIMAEMSKAEKKEEKKPKTNQRVEVEVDKALADPRLQV